MKYYIFKYWGTIYQLEHDEDNRFLFGDSEYTLWKLQTYDCYGIWPMKDAGTTNRDRVIIKLCQIWVYSGGRIPFRKFLKMTLPKAKLAKRTRRLSSY